MSAMKKILGLFISSIMMMSSFTYALTGWDVLITQRNTWNTASNIILLPLAWTGINMVMWLNWVTAVPQYMKMWSGVNFDGTGLWIGWLTFSATIWLTSNINDLWNGFTGMLSNLTGEESFATWLLQLMTWFNFALTGTQASVLGKEPIISTGLNTQYRRWDKTRQTLPLIPTLISAFTNDIGYITSTSIPTLLSQLSNNVWYITWLSLNWYLTGNALNGYLTGSSLNEYITGLSLVQYITWLQLTPYITWLALNGYITWLSLLSYITWLALTPYLTGWSLVPYITGLSLSGYATVNYVNTGLALKQNLFTGTVNQFVLWNGSYGTWSQSSVTRTLDSWFQVSSTKWSNVAYSVWITAVASLAWWQTGAIILEMSPTCGFTGTQEIGRMENGNSVSLAIALTATQMMSSQLNGFIPWGYCVRLRTAWNANTFAWKSWQEMLIG